MKRFLSIVLLLVLAPLSQNWASELTKDSGLSESTSADSGSQINNALQLQDNLNNETHPLQVHEAFPLSVVAIDDKTLVINWLGHAVPEELKNIGSALVSMHKLE